MDLNSLKTNRALETEGVWQPVLDGEVRVARIDNPKAARLFQRYTRPYRRQIDNGTMDPAKQEEIMCRVLSEAVLLDWRGLEEDGQPLPPYSPEEGFRVLSEYRELRDMVRDYAQDAQAYRDHELEDAEKN